MSDENNRAGASCPICTWRRGLQELTHWLFFLYTARLMIHSHFYSSVINVSSAALHRALIAKKCVYFCTALYCGYCCLLWFLWLLVSPWDSKETNNCLSDSVQLNIDFRFRSVFFNLFIFFYFFYHTLKSFTVLREPLLIITTSSTVHERFPSSARCETFYVKE